MSRPFASEQLARIAADASALATRVSHHEAHLDIFIALAEADVRHLEAAISAPLEAAPPGDDLVVRTLRLHLQRSVDRADMARQLCVTAREQRAAADWLASRVHHDRLTNPEEPQHAPRRHPVLVVDDSDQIREFVGIVLQNAGFVVRTARNGLEGLIAAHEMRPTVIVMDVAMPTLDGIETARLIRAADATRNARIIAHTAEPTVVTSPDAERLFDKVLPKPVPAAVIVAAVQGFIQRAC
jgi:CheY-like chemotaxis protein